MKEKDNINRLRNELAALRRLVADLEALETRHEHMEEELREANERLNAVLKASPEAIVTLKPDGTVTMWNNAAERVFGWTSKEVIGKFNPMVPANKLDEFKALREKVIKGGSLSGKEVRRRRKDGSLIDISISTAPLTDKRGKNTGIVAVISDITERKKMERRLRTLSLKDELTGLFNRRGFLTFARPQLKIANRRKEGVLLLYADVDGLKKVNDKFGHRAGDMILVTTARLIKKVFRETDTMARIGGDEFVVLSVQTQDSEGEVIKKRFKKNLEQYNAGRSHVFRLSVSTGIVYYKPVCPYSIEELLVQGDRMMYRQKRCRKKSRTV